MDEDWKAQVAGIEYAGISGMTDSCIEAIQRYISFGDEISKARIVSHDNGHGILLKIGTGDPVLVKDGFGSDYGGGGPTGFSYVLALLKAHGVPIDEIDANADLFKRGQDGTLTIADLELIEEGQPVRPSRVYEYMNERHEDRGKQGLLWRDFRPVIPFAIIDPRVADLALSFWNEPDQQVLKAYRRLEDILRTRANLTGHGVLLFRQVFQGTKNDLARLGWPELTQDENATRGEFFAASYAAFRNPRAHRERSETPEDILSEFLVVNQLFRLESQAEGVSSNLEPAPAPQS